MSKLLIFLLSSTALATQPTWAGRAPNTNPVVTTPPQDNAQNPSADTPPNNGNKPKDSTPVIDTPKTDIPKTDSPKQEETNPDKASGGTPGVANPPINEPIEKNKANTVPESDNTVAQSAAQVALPMAGIGAFIAGISLGKILHTISNTSTLSPEIKEAMEAVETARNHDEQEKANPEKYTEHYPDKTTKYPSIDHYTTAASNVLEYLDKTTAKGGDLTASEKANVKKALEILPESIKGRYKNYHNLSSFKNAHKFYAVNLLKYYKYAHFYASHNPDDKELRKIAEDARHYVKTEMHNFQRNLSSDDRLQIAVHLGTQMEEALGTNLSTDKSQEKYLLTKDLDGKRHPNNNLDLNEGIKNDLLGLPHDAVDERAKTLSSTSHETLSPHEVAIQAQTHHETAGVYMDEAKRTADPEKAKTFLEKANQHLDKASALWNKAAEKVSKEETHQTATHTLETLHAKDAAVLNHIKTTSSNLEITATKKGSDTVKATKQEYSHMLQEKIKATEKLREAHTKALEKITEKK